MPTFKRMVANAIERITGRRIAAPARIGAIYASESVRRLITSFDVDCVFDVGANAGQFARTLRDAVKYSGPIVSYEPVPFLARQLQALADCANGWYVREVALDRQIGNAWLTITRDSQFSSLQNVSKVGQSMFPQQVAVSEKLKVETSTLAVEFKHWRDRIDFRRPYLKLDTQGNDLAVAEGAGDLIGEFVAIQAELAIRKVYEEAPSVVEAFDFFHDRGFEPSAFVPNNEGTFPLLVETDCIFISRKYASCLLGDAALSCVPF